MTPHQALWGGSKGVHPHRPEEGGLPPGGATVGAQMQGASRQEIATLDHLHHAQETPIPVDQVHACYIEGEFECPGDRTSSRRSMSKFLDNPMVRAAWTTLIVCMVYILRRTLLSCYDLDSWTVQVEEGSTSPNTQHV